MPITTSAERGEGVTLSTYLAPSEAERVRALAAGSERTVAAVLRFAIRDYLHNDERRPGQGAAVKTPAEAGRHAEP